MVVTPNPNRIRRYQYELDALEKVAASHQIEENFLMGMVADAGALIACGRLLQRAGHQLSIRRTNDPHRREAA